PLDTLLHRLAVRAPVGRPGRPRQVPPRQAPLGVARPRRPLPGTGVEQVGEATAPHTRPTDVPALAPAAHPLPRPDLHFRGRRRLRDARGGPVLQPPPESVNTGQQTAPRGQPVRPATGLLRPWSASGQGPPTPQAPRGGHCRRE